MKYKMPAILRRTSFTWWLFIFIVLIIFKIGTCGNSVAVANTYAVWGNFTNTLILPPGTNPPVEVSTSATFFGGHVLPYDNPDVPTDGTYKLVSSSFGQVVSKEIPYPGFEDETRNNTLKKLYYDHADDSEGNAKADAAFRYKALLYSGSGKDVSAQFKKMEDYWTNEERERAFVAANSIRDALVYSPNDNGLRNALLDIYYDIAVAEVSLANERLVAVERCALGIDVGAPELPPGETTISTEISLLDEIVFGSEDSVPAYDNALENYFSLLTDPMGIDISRVTSSETNMPFGYYLFKEEVPQRSLYAPSYDDPNDNTSDLKPVIDDGTGNSALLFTGFKDLVLLFQIERDLSQASAKLAKLYALRGTAKDIQRANNIIRDIQQRSYTEGAILNGLIKDMNQIDEYSGLGAAHGGWAQALSSLSGVKAFLEGKANPLGLDKDFLALVQKKPSAGYDDTFGYFAKTLMDDKDGPLQDAYKKWQDAVAQYQKVMENRDTIAQYLTDNRSRYENRLLEITGASSMDDPEYKTPWDNTGSEIYQQIQNINLAKLKINKNTQEIANLNKQIEIEIERQGKEHGINNLIEDTYIDYGNKRAHIIEEISYITAIQKASDAIARGTESWLVSLGAGTVGGAINAAIQYGGDIHKGQLEAQKERYAAQQSANITYLNDNISAANSEAHVKTLFLGMSVLAIESQEAAIQLAQEMGKLQALYNEKAYLESRWKEDDAKLGDRYYADPSHRMILDKYILDASYAFDIAQVWVFMMARALEYKCIPYDKESKTIKVVTQPNTNKVSYSPNTAFFLRNANELKDMAVQLKTYDSTHKLGERFGTQFVKFSLREDFLGFKRVDKNDNTRYYADPLTGEIVDALTAFRSYLKDPKRHGVPKDPNMAKAFSEVVHIEFNTAKSNRQSTFFSPLRWNEKINYISVKINTTDPIDQVAVWLEQSGTGYIRTKEGGIVDPQNPDQLIGEEMIAYPIQFFDHDAYNINKWHKKESFGLGINAMISKDPDAEPESYKKEEFSDFTPAVSTWVLEVPLKTKEGDIILKTENISDIEIWFYNNYYSRLN
ncbi:MAG: hypothetical protein U0586_15305 [Candidatus Brocadiaceae bacterium]